MRILHIVSSLPKKGWPRNTFIKSQIDSLKEIGIEVDIFEVNSWPGKKINYFLGFFELRKYLKNNEYDLIHAHYIYSGLIAISQRRVPVVYSYMGSEILGTPDISGKLTLLGRINILLSRLLQYFVDEIIVKSENLLEKLDPNLSINVVPNGVNFNTFRPMDKKECREKLGLNKRNKIVLFLGKTDDPRKNYSLAQSSIEYLNSYSSKRINIELVAPNSIAPEEVPVYLNASDVLLQAPKIKRIPISAVASVSTSGVLVTTIFFFFAASRSIFPNPTAKFEIIFTLSGNLLIVSASILSVNEVKIPSQP